MKRKVAFETYEGIKGKKCGQCKIRFPTSGHCIEEGAYVAKTDPACKKFAENT